MTISLVTATTAIVVVKIHIVVVTIKTVISTILICRGYIKKMFCLDNKIIFSVQLDSTFQNNYQ